VPPLIGTGAGVSVSALFGLIVAFHLGGLAFSRVVDDVGTIGASLLAAIACASAARNSRGALRLAWALLSASAATWCLGQLIRAVYESIAGTELSYLSWADVPILAATPLAVIGVLTFPAATGAPARSWRYWLDAVIIAMAFFFVAWALGLGTILHSAGPGLGSDAAKLAAPLGDIVLTTALILAIGRASYQQRNRMLLLLAGVAATAVAGIAFGILIGHQRYPTTGTVVDTGWVAGYLLIALAAVWPDAADAEGAGFVPIDTRQLLLPWFVVFLAGLTTVMLALSGQRLDPLLTVLAGILFVLLMMSQVVAQRESIALLLKSMHAEATLAQLIARAPVGIARLSGDMTVANANPRLTTLLHLAGNGRADPRMYDRLPSPEVDRMTAQLHRLSSDSDTAEGDSEYRRDDGSSAWLHWNAAIGGRENGEDYYIVMFEDVTAARTATEAAAANLAALEHINELKTEFLTTFRHEFRTALVGIEGFGELMSSEEVGPDEVKSYAKEILNDAKRLDRMINELMDLDQVEKARTAMARAAVDLNHLVTDVVTAIRTEGVRNVIKTDLDPATPAVAGDRALLESLLKTLIRNAAQYSPRSGRIEVATSRVPGFAQAVVRDQGLGTRSDFQDRMFGPKELYVESPMRKVIGTELGLAMARRVVEMHGGRIWVERVEGVGSEVFFTLPELAHVGASSSAEAD
jgi:signal transduction histidine kinase